VTDRAGVKHNIKQLERVKTWQLLVLLLLVGFIAATLLRLNNIGMVERRTAVINADKAGNTDDVARRLYDLQRYVSSHMNTDMGRGIYLQEQYSKDRQQAMDQAAGSGSSSGNIYKKITDECRALYSAWTPYFQCVQDRLNASTPATDPVQKASLPQPETYRHVFVSPLWSPDFAGLSVVVWFCILLLIITRLVSLVVLRALLKRHYKTV
jgi:hypothetical protein